MKERARSDAQKEIRRRQLLDHALALFGANGYRRTTVALITASAGLSPGTFYLYFANKLEVYRILYREGIGILDGMIGAAIGWPGMTPAAQLSAVAGAYQRFFTEQRGYFDIIAILHIGNPEFSVASRQGEALDRLAIGVLRRIEAILQHGIDQGDFAPMDTWETTTTLYGMLDGIFLLNIREDARIAGSAFDRLFKRGVDILLHGLVRRPSP